MFGKSYLLDLYNCKNGVCDDMEVHYRFLEEMVHRLDMKPLCSPIVIHCPVTFAEKDGNLLRLDNFPDKAGCSGWIGLATSGIQIHSIEPQRFCSIDIYSCKDFDINLVREIVYKYFQFEKYEENVVNRGLDYCHGV